MLVSSDQDDVPPAQASTGRRPVRESARSAHRAWEQMIPKSKPPKDKEREKTKYSEYPPPNIGLNTSDDESPPPHKSVDKTSAASSEGALDNDKQDDSEVLAHSQKSDKSKDKQKARSHQGSDEESSNSAPEGRIDGDDENDEDNEELSESSGLRELERNDPSTLKAKFDSEAPAWVDGSKELDDDNLSPPPSPFASPRAPVAILDTDGEEQPPKPKCPRVVSLHASENEDAQSRSPPAKKKSKAEMPVDTSEWNMDSADDDYHGKSKRKEQTAQAKEDAEERKCERRCEHERERKKEQARVEHAKECAKERERQRKELEEYHQREEERNREEEREHRHEEERKRMKQREWENKCKREEEHSREMERDHEMEREYKCEHEKLRKLVQRGPEEGKGHGRNQRELEETQDEPEQARGSSRNTTRPTPMLQWTAGPPRSYPPNKGASSSRTRLTSSRTASHAAMKAMAGPGQSSRRRKCSKQDKVIAFVSDKGNDSSDQEPPSRRHHPQVDEQLPSDDDDDTSVEIVWFGNSHPNLTNQHPVCTANAFPDDLDDDSFTHNVLIKHAKALGYKVMMKMLKDKKDNMYWKKLSMIPAQCVYLLRGKVKSKCEGAVRSVYGLTVGDSEKVAWLEKDLAYIFPHNYETRTVIGKEGYKPAIFENMLMALFFSRQQSYGYRIIKHFTSSHPDKPDEKEIPAAMLALVSTAIFAAIDDFKQAHYDAAKFEVNPNLHVYQCNIVFLDHIKDKNIDAYHVLMHGLFKHITSGAGISSNVGHGIGYLDVDGMERS